MATIVVVDVETSGLDPVRHGIIDIGAVALSWPDLEMVGEFRLDVRLEDAKEWDPESEQVHGVSECDARHYLRRPGPYSAVDMLAAWVEAASRQRRVMLAGMNPAFDRCFLRAAAADQNRFDALFSHRLLDMHSLAVAEGWRWGLSAEEAMGLNTDTIYGLLGMVPEPRPHRAIVGARMEAAAIRCLLTGDDDGVPADFLPSAEVRVEKSQDGEEVAA